MFDVFDDFRSDVATGDFFDAEARRGVDLEDERTASGAHDVDAADVEAHGFCGFEGDFLFFVGELNRGAGAALMEVRAKVVVERSALHGGNDAVANDASADIGAGGFFNELWEQAVGAVFIVKIERLESGFCRLFGVGEDDAVAVSAGGKLDDDGETNLFEEVVDVRGVARDECLWRVDVIFSEDLRGAQFVTGAGDGDRSSRGPDALHFELTDDGAAVAGHVVRDAGQNGVEAFEFFAFVEDVGVFVIEGKVAVFVLDDLDFVTTFFRLFNEAFGGIVGVAVG